MSSGGRRNERDEKKSYGDRSGRTDSRQSRPNPDRRPGYSGDGYSRGSRLGRGGRNKVQPMSGNSSSSSTPSTAASGGSSHQVLGIPDPATGQNGAVVDFNSVLAQIWAQNPDQVPVLVAGASVISYCKSCWKVCQMEIPPGKVELDLSEFRCFSCAGAEVTGMNGAGNGEEESDQANNEGDEVVSVDWHRPASGVPVQQVYHQNEMPGGSRPQRARHEHRILIP